MLPRVGATHTLLPLASFASTTKRIQIMTYINGRTPGTRETETIDQCDTRREARALIAEYRLAFAGSFDVWLSSRATVEWRATA